MPISKVVSPSKEKVQPSDSDPLPYIGLEHIEKDRGTLVGQGTSVDVRSTKTVFSAGDVLYGKLRPYLNKVVIAPFDGVCSTDILVYPEVDGLDPRFLAYRLLSKDFVRYASHNSSGVNLPRVNAKTVGAFEIDLPPIDEQRRIVEKIEELFSQLDAGVEALEKVQVLLKRYRQSVLKAAVEGRLTEAWREEHKGEIEPASAFLKRVLEERRTHWELSKMEEFKKKGKSPQKGWQARYKSPIGPDISGLPQLPNGWTWATVDQLASVRTGATPLRSEETYWKDGSIPWVTSSSVNQDFIQEASEFVTDKALQETNLTVFPTSTLLVAMYGEGKTRGKVSELLIEATTNQACAALVFGPHGLLCKDYLKIFFQYNYQNLRRRAVGGAQPNLNLTIIKSTAVPLPPQVEQVAICRLFIGASVLADRLGTSLVNLVNEATTLRDAILLRAFSGGLLSESDPKPKKGGPRSMPLVSSGIDAAKDAPTEVGSSSGRGKGKDDNKLSTETQLSDILRYHHSEMSPDELLRLSGLGVEDFYEQLKHEIDAGLISEVGNTNRRLRLK